MRPNSSVYGPASCWLAKVLHAASGSSDASSSLHGSVSVCAG